MTTKEPGYVYILTNPSFREDWVKIGKSSRPVDIRSKELDNTAVPLPFDIYATMKTVKYNEAESLVHGLMDQLTDKRIRKNREFFNLRPEEALKLFQRVANVIDDAEIVVFNNAQTQKHESHTGKTRRPVMRFYQMGMQNGDMLVWKADPSITATIFSDTKVLYEGQEIALSLLTQKLKGANYYVCAQNFWTYNGRLLSDIYNEVYPSEE